MSHREGLALQKGMNFRVRAGAAGYSIILMSVRKNAPYQDQWHDDRGGGPHAGLQEYEGHDAPRSGGSNPKRIDQPLTLPSGKPTDNGKFYQAAMAAKSGHAPPEVVQVYEKIANGIWCDRGRHLLVDAEIKTVPIFPTRATGPTAPRRTSAPSTKTRKVLRFYLRPTTTPAVATREDERELSISRQIPTHIKVAV